MVVGGRFNAPQVAKAIAQITDLRVYSSVPASYWPEVEKCVRFVPHVSLLLGKLTRRSPGRRFKDVST